MNRKLVVGAALIVAAGVAVVVYGPAGRRAPASTIPSAVPTSSHAAGIDHSMAAVLALYTTEATGTPCERAYAAYKASLDVSTQQHATAIVLRLAPRDEFMGRCTALPGPVQQCVVPSYKWAHQAECDKAKPPDDVLAAMVELKKKAEPGTPGAEWAPPEPAPIGSR